MTSNHENVYFYSAPALEGTGKTTLNMADFKGKVLIILNVACEWGLTVSNYKQLNELHEKYNSQGLEIIAQPCNQFGKQEPKQGQALYDDLATNPKYSFPKFLPNYFARNDVNGKNASELFLYLQNHKNCPGILGIDKIKWNFSKFLIGRDGVPVKRFAPKDEPVKMEKYIQEELAKASL